MGEDEEYYCCVDCGDIHPKDDLNENSVCLFCENRNKHGKI